MHGKKQRILSLVLAILMLTSTFSWGAVAYGGATPDTLSDVELIYTVSTTQEGVGIESNQFPGESNTGKLRQVYVTLSVKNNSTTAFKLFQIKSVLKYDSTILAPSSFAEDEYQNEIQDVANGGALAYSVVGNSTFGNHIKFVTLTQDTSNGTSIIPEIEFVGTPARPNNAIGGGLIGNWSDYITKYNESSSELTIPGTESGLTSEIPICTYSFAIKDGAVVADDSFTFGSPTQVYQYQDDAGQYWQDDEILNKTVTVVAPTPAPVIAADPAPAADGATGDVSFTVAGLGTAAGEIPTDTSFTVEAYIGEAWQEISTLADPSADPPQSTDLSDGGGTNDREFTISTNYPPLRTALNSGNVQMRISAQAGDKEASEATTFTVAQRPNVYLDNITILASNIVDAPASVKPGVLPSGLPTGSVTFKYSDTVAVRAAFNPADPAEENFIVGNNGDGTQTIYFNGDWSQTDGNPTSVDPSTQVGSVVYKILLANVDGAYPIQNTDKSVSLSYVISNGSMDADLSSLEITDGAAAPTAYTLSPAFDKDTSEYSIWVPYGTASVTVNAAVNDPTATMKIAGQEVKLHKTPGAEGEDDPVNYGTNNITLNFDNGIDAAGTHKIPVEITAENPKVIQTYTITVKQAGDNTLSELGLTRPALEGETGAQAVTPVQVSDPPADPPVSGFASDVAQYTATVPFGTNSITLAPVLSDSNSTIWIGTTLDALTQVTDASQEVTLPDDSTKDPVTVYVKVVPKDFGTDPDDNPDAQEKTYQIAVTRAADNTLDGIDTTIGTWDQTFNKNTTSYTIRVPYNAGELGITPKITAADVTGNEVITVAGNAAAVNKMSVVSLEAAGKTTTILVSSKADADGAAQTYSLTVERSLNPYLIDVELSAGVALNESFDTEKTNYTINLPGGIGSVDFKAVFDAEMTTSTLSYSIGTEQFMKLENTSLVSTVSLNSGETKTFRYKVVPASASMPSDERIYTFVVNRAGAEDSDNPVNNVNDLTAVTVTEAGGNEVALAAAFNKDITTYHGSVANTVDAVDVTATIAPETIAAGATIQIGKDLQSLSTATSGTAVKVSDLAVGDNDIYVAVNAKNGTAKYYQITINRATANENPDPDDPDDPDGQDPTTNIPKNNDTTVDGITLTDGDPGNPQPVELIPNNDPFDPSQKNYEAIIPETGDIQIQVAMQDNGSTVEITLPDGTVIENGGTIENPVPGTIITITTTAEDGTTKDVITITLKAGTGTISGKAKTISVIDDHTVSIHVMEHGKITGDGVDDWRGWRDALTEDDYLTFNSEKDGSFACAVEPGSGFVDVVVDRGGYLDYIILNVPVEAGKTTEVFTGDIIVLEGDIDKNGTVAFEDLGKFKGEYGKQSTDTATAKLSDFDNNGTVAFEDLGKFKGQYGKNHIIVTCQNTPQS